MPDAPAGELRSPQSFRNRCAVQPPSQLGPHELSRLCTAVRSVRVLLLVTEPVADLYVVACMGAPAADRHDVVDGGRQRIGASAGGINRMAGISADTAHPVITLTDLVNAERFDGPICPDEGAAALVLSSGDNLCPSLGSFQANASQSEGLPHLQRTERDEFRGRPAGGRSGSWYEGKR